MPIKIQNAAASGALVEFFGIKGRMLQQLDETVVPVAIVADVTDSGVAGVRTYQEVVQPAAVVAEFPIATFFGADGFIVRPQWVMLSPSATADFTIQWELHTVFPVYTGSLVTRGVEFGGDHGPGPSIVQGGSVAAITGQRVARARVNTGETTRRIDLRGWELRGNLDSLAINTETVNTAGNFTMCWTVESDL